MNIGGITRTTDANGANTTAAGGLLALSSNIGNYSRSQFAVVPEFGMNLGYQLSPHLEFKFGYTFIYWMRGGKGRRSDRLPRQSKPDTVCWHRDRRRPAQSCFRVPRYRILGTRAELWSGLLVVISMYHPHIFKKHFASITEERHVA